MKREWIVSVLLPAALASSLSVRGAGILAQSGEGDVWHGTVTASNGQMQWQTWDRARISLDPQLVSFLTNKLVRSQSMPIKCEKTFGQSADHVYALMNGMSNQMIAKGLDLRLGDTPKEVARRIQVASDAYIHGKDIANENLKCFLTAQAYFDWIRTHFKFDKSLNDGKYVGEERLKRYDLNQVLGMDVPSTTCGLYSWTAAYISALGGFTHIRKIEGVLQWSPDKTKIVHYWNKITLSDGTVCFPDPTIATIGLDEARRRSGNIINPHSLPIEEWTQGFFLTTHYGRRLIDMVPLNNGDWHPHPVVMDTDPFVNNSIGDWDLRGNKYFDQFRKNFDKDMATATVETKS